MESNARTPKRSSHRHHPSGCYGLHEDVVLRTISTPSRRIFEKIDRLPGSACPVMVICPPYHWEGAILHVINRILSTPSTRNNDGEQAAPVAILLAKFSFQVKDAQFKFESLIRKKSAITVQSLDEDASFTEQFALLGKQQPTILISTAHTLMAAAARKKISLSRLRFLIVYNAEFQFASVGTESSQFKGIFCREPDWSCKVERLQTILLTVKKQWHKEEQQNVEAFAPKFRRICDLEDETSRSSEVVNRKESNLTDIPASHSCNIDTTDPQPESWESPRTWNPTRATTDTQSKVEANAIIDTSAHAMDLAIDELIAEHRPEKATTQAQEARAVPTMVRPKQYQFSSCSLQDFEDGCTVQPSDCPIESSALPVTSSSPGFCLGTSVMQPLYWQYISAVSPTPPRLASSPSIPRMEYADMSLTMPSETPPGRALMVVDSLSSLDDDTINPETFSQWNKATPMKIETPDVNDEPQEEFNNEDLSQIYKRIYTKRQLNDLGISWTEFLTLKGFGALSTIPAANPLVAAPAEDPVSTTRPLRPQDLKIILRKVNILRGLSARGLTWAEYEETMKH